MPYNDERSGLEVITLSECVQLLESQEVARVAFSANGVLQLLPINFAWDGEGIVFRCESDSSLIKSVGTEVVLEVDGMDQRNRTGWSILARGIPVSVEPDRTPELATRLRRLPLYPWVGGEKGHWLRLIPAPLTGRRVNYIAP
jgi:hypothetical protein